MANNTTGNVWELDTAGVISTNPVVVKNFVYKPGANNDDLLVLDNLGRTILDVKAPADITTVPQLSVAPGGPGGQKTFQGLDLNTIDGGTLYVYLG